MDNNAQFHELGTKIDALIRQLDRVKEGPSMLVDQREAARLLGISPRSVFTLVKGGDLPAVRFGQCVRIDRRDIDDLINNRKNASIPA